MVCCQGLVGGRKKRIIRYFGPLGFEPWTLGSKSALPPKPYFPDHSSLPTEKCLFFASDFLPHNNNSTQNERLTMTSSVLVSYDRCSGAEPTPSHIQSANMIIRGLLLLLLLIVLALYPLFIFGCDENVYEFPSFVKEQRQHQRSAAT